MSSIFKSLRQVEFRDTDAAGIVHFSVFFLYMEEAEHELLRSRGLSVLEHSDQGTISWPRVSCRCDYRSPLRFEDRVQIDVSIARLGSKSITYAFVFSCEGRSVAEGEVTAVCCRLVANEAPQSIEIPDWMRQRLADQP